MVLQTGEVMDSSITPRSAKMAAEQLANNEHNDVFYRGSAFKLVGALADESIDLIFSSPPYCMGKDYESSTSVDDFIQSHELLLPQLCRALKPGGSICWQVGYHVKNGVVTPLDFLAHEIFSKIEGMRLRNRIVWTFDHGLHAKKRFSGRHETVLWYSKGEPSFDLDAVRVPQKYPGKRSYRGPRKGELSGNPLGKNPGDVWAIPNVKGGHQEKTHHPCQFPVALPQAFVRALSAPGGIVFDPFMGVGSTGVAAALEGRRFVGSEIVASYVKVARERVRSAREGTASYRPFHQPIHMPKPTDAVAKKPDHFRG